VQGFVQGFSVYVDTLLINSATAFAILITGVYNVENGMGGFIVQNVPADTSGPGFTQLAVNAFLPGFGPAFVAVALFMFAFACILSYYYMSETNFLYLFKNTSPENVKKILIPLQLVFFAVTFLGSVITANTAWGFGDIGVGMMAWVNLTAIWFLHPRTFRILRDYEKQLKENPDKIAFDPRPLGIKNAKYWEDRFDSGVDK
jgi:AGCS family alanine or glycine:cation symporter